MVELGQAIAKLLTEGIPDGEWSGEPSVFEILRDHYYSGPFAKGRAEDLARGYVEALAVATGQLVPAVAWQPIETAPRDGTQILACLWAYGQPGGERRYEVVSWECDGWASEAYPIYPPTHWMPLPPPPAEGV